MNGIHVEFNQQTALSMLEVASQLAPYIKNEEANQAVARYKDQISSACYELETPKTKILAKAFGCDHNLVIKLLLPYTELFITRLVSHVQFYSHEPIQFDHLFRMHHYEPLQFNTIFTDNDVNCLDYTFVFWF